MFIGHDLAWIAMSGAFVLGMVLALGHCLLPAIQVRLHCDERQARALASTSIFVLIPASLLSGMLVDRRGILEVFYLGSVTTGLALFILAMSRTYRIAWVASAALGAGCACLNISTCVLFPAAFFPYDLAASTNLGFVFYGLGAMLMPLLIPALMRGLGWQRGVSLLAAFALVPGLIALLLSNETASPTRQSVEFNDVLLNPYLWFAGLAFVLYSSLEGFLDRFAAPYLGDLGVTSRRSTIGLALCWLLFLGARLLTAFSQHQDLFGRHSDPWIAFILTLLAAVAIGNLAGTHGRGGALIGMGALGAVLGPIFPLLVALVFASVTPADYGTAYGMTFALGALGNSLVVSFEHPDRARRTVLRMRLAASLSLVLVVLILALG